jgi:hypothetical protein
MGYKLGHGGRNSSGSYPPAEPLITLVNRDFKNTGSSLAYPVGNFLHEFDCYLQTLHKAGITSRWYKTSWCIYMLNRLNNLTVQNVAVNDNSWKLHTAIKLRVNLTLTQFV